MYRFPDISSLKNTRVLFVVILSVTLFAYILVRAYTLEITVDECTSYNLIKSPYLKVLASTANTHWLNTLLMGCVSFFSWEIFYLRMPNVFAFLLFAYFVYRLAMIFPNRLYYIVLSIFFFNHYLIDFFSLARGYAMAMAFMLGSIYYLNKAINCNQKDAWKWSVLLGVAALLANYTLIFYLVVLAVLYFYYVRMPKTRLDIILYLILGATITGALANLAIIHIYGNDLIAGKRGYFYETTLLSQISNWFYTFSIPDFVKYSITILFCIVFVIHAAYCVLKKSMQLSIILILGCTFLLMVSNYVFGILYPAHRTALFYAILIAYWFIELLVMLAVSFSQYQIKTISLLLSLALAVFFLFNANFSKVIEWEKPHESQLVFDDIMRYHKKKGGEFPIFVAAEWSHYHFIKDYYQRTYLTMYPMSLVQTKKGYFKNVQYITAPMSQCERLILETRGALLKKYPASQVCLIQIK